jgi:hypothetical protein
MKKISILVAALLVNFNSLMAQPNCSATLWSHVYHPNRFTLWKKCTSVTGVIMHLKKEADGDYHIQLKLDPGQPRFLNQRNMDIQKGCLVLEIICFNKVTQVDAIQPCKRCSRNITVPGRGDHVKVTGSFVKDLERNHGWNEIHPVSLIEAL